MHGLDAPLHMGILLIWKPIVVSFGRQQIEQPATARAGKHAACQPVRGVPESAWSPDAQKPPRGVHRSPRGLVLSLLFLVKTSVSD
jgi:hypothetical protein